MRKKEKGKRKKEKGKRRGWVGGNQFYIMKTKVNTKSLPIAWFMVNIHAFL
jgi:hypothetical protein